MFQRWPQWLYYNFRAIFFGFSLHSMYEFGIDCCRRQYDGCMMVTCRHLKFSHVRLALCSIMIPVPTHNFSYCRCSRSMTNRKPKAITRANTKCWHRVVVIMKSSLLWTLVWHPPPANNTLIAIYKSKYVWYPFWPEIRYLFVVFVISSMMDKIK